MTPILVFCLFFLQCVMSNTCVRAFTLEESEGRERADCSIGRQRGSPSLYVPSWIKKYPHQNPPSHPARLHRLVSGKHLTN